MTRFYIYVKTGNSCSYVIKQAESLDALAAELRVCKPCWAVGRVIGHRRVKLACMPHDDAILISGNSQNFIAIEYASNARQIVEPNELDEQFSRY